MKIRSASELNAFLDTELAWRKREITASKFLLERTRKHEQALVLRGGVCILYAHWEGFVKQAAIGYLNYISRLGLQYHELIPSLVALSIRSRFRVAEESNRITIRASLTQFLLSDLKEDANIPWSDAINARDNLNSEVLQEILCLLGLDYTNYATKASIIDAKLLHSRNKIAHGEQSDLSVEDYQELHDEVIALVNLFKNDVENAALTKSYLKRV